MVEEEGSQIVEIAGLGDKRQITTTFAISMSGAVLPAQIMYTQERTPNAIQCYVFPESFDIWHTPNHCANAETKKQFIHNIVVLYAAGVRAQVELPNNHPAIVIYDAFRGHSGEEVQALLFYNHFISVKVPSNCTDWLQPLDLSVNKALKDQLRKSFTDWYAC